MDSIGKILQKKASLIDVDKKLQLLELAQNELERFFDKTQAKVFQIGDKVVTVKVRSSAVASELRMSQTAYLAGVSKALEQKFSKIIIRTGKLND